MREVDRRSAQVLMERGIAAERSGSIAEALHCYQEAARTQPEFVAAHMSLGIACEALGDLVGAVASYARVIALDPEYAPGHYNLGLARLRNGNWLEAESSTTPSNLELMVGLG